MCPNWFGQYVHQLERASVGPVVHLVQLAKKLLWNTVSWSFSNSIISHIEKHKHD